MNYGISSGGGFGVTIPLGGYGGNQSNNTYQGQGWNSTQGGSWSQPSINYSQPTYNQPTYSQPTGWGYSQPTNQGWSTMQPTGWSGQAYSQPQQTYY